MCLFKGDSLPLIDTWTGTGKNNPEVLSITGSLLTICPTWSIQFLRICSWCREGGFEHQCQTIRHAWSHAWWTGNSKDLRMVDKRGGSGPQCMYYNFSLWFHSYFTFLYHWLLNPLNSKTWVILSMTRSTISDSCPFRFDSLAIIRYDSLSLWLISHIYKLVDTIMFSS
jgi:hypothetical protein